MFQAIVKQRLAGPVAHKSISKKKTSPRNSDEYASDITSFTDLLETNRAETSAATQAPALNRELVSADEKAYLEMRAKTASLVGQLNSIGDRLINNPSLKTYLLYKQSMKDILKLTTTKTYGIDKFRMKTMNESLEKEFHVITVINKELNSLLMLVRETHQDKLKIASKLISLKGLVVNFVL